MSLKQKALLINNELKKLFPKASISLNYSNAWELLVAVILSAQCTDKKVNEVTKKLFKKYKSIEDYASVSISEFQEDIKPTGFYKNKSKNIINAAKIIISKYNGKVPKKMDELLNIPGIGRKSANVILGNAFGIVEGIIVDTHVTRLSKKWGLTKEKNPEKIEKDLMKLIPKKDWLKFSYRVIKYGRKYAPARKKDNNDPISNILKSYRN